MTPPKLLRTVAFSILTFLFAVAMGVNTSFAQTTYYVDTGGSDTNNGLAASQSGSDGPVETIAQALSYASDGDIISIEAGVYAEDVTVTKTVSFVARTTGSQTLVNFQDLIMNGSGKTLTFTANGSNTFSLDNITLTQGAVNTGTGLVAMTGTTVNVGDGATAGTLTGDVDFPTNVSVDYDIDADYATGDELPSDLGTGTLTVLTTGAGTALDLTKDVEVTTFDLQNGTGDGVIGSSTVTVNAGAAVAVNDSFTGNLVVNVPTGQAYGFTLAAGEEISGNVTISQTNSSNAASGVGAVTLNGDVTGEVSVSNAGDAGVGTFTLDAAATLTGDFSISNDGTANPVNVNGDIDGDVSLDGAGTMNLAGTVDGNVELDSALDLAAAAEVTGSVTTDANVTTSGAGAELGSLVVTGTNTVGSADELTVNGDISINSGTMTTGGSITTTNMTINSGNTLTLAAGHTLTMENGSFISDNGSFNGTATSVLQFTGTTSGGTFTPGSNFEVGSIVVNKAGQTVTLTDDAELTSTGAALTVTNGTLDLESNTLTVSADGDVSVATNGTISSDTATQGGVFFTADNATISGDGYSNIIINAANSIALAGDVTFSGNLNFISGSINGGAFDISPEADGQLVTVNPENSDGVIGTATFNNAGLEYDLTYDGVLTAAQTIGNELTSDAQNVTISTEDFALILPNADVEIQNLTVKTDAILQGDNTADHTITVNGTLTTEDDSEIASAAGFTLTLDLAGNGSTHSLAGSVTDGGTAAVVVNITGDNVTVNGTGTEDADNNYADAMFTVDGTGATVADLQWIDMVTVSDDAGLTLNLITSEEHTALNEDYGVVNGGVAIGDGATLTLSSSTAIASGILDIDGAGTVALGGNDLKFADGLTADIEGAAGATVTSTGGFVEMGGAATLSADGASIPYLRIEGTINEDVTIATMLDVTGAINNTGADVTLSGDMDVSGSITGGTFTTDGGGTFTADANVTISALTVEDGLTLASNNTTARTFTVTGSYTHTSGDVELGRNTLLLDGINLDLTVGAYTSSTGTGGINMNSSVALDINTGDTDLSIPNLTVSGANDVSLTNDDILTILGSVTFSAAGNLNAQDANDEEIRLADDATVFRSAAGTFTEAPTFEGVINLDYTGALTTDNEAPASAQNVTVNNGGTLTLSDDLQVTGTLSLSDVLDDAGNDLLIAADGEIEFATAAGSLTNDIDTDSEGYTVIHRVANAGLDVAAASAYAGSDYSITVDNEASSTITVTIATTSPTFVNVNVGAGDQINLADTYNLTVEGDFTGVTNPIVDMDNSTITFSGSSEQTINLTSQTIDAGASGLVFNNSAGINLATGNLIVAAGGPDVTFTAGVVSTGTSNYIQLDHVSTSDQGFTRTNGQVLGNVRKQLPSSGTASNRVEFPVGGNNVDGVSGGAEDEYSPVAVTFTTPNTLPSGVFMTVGHTESNPGGLNGFPIVDGVEEGENIVRYPDEFYWTIKTSTSLPATQEYSLEMEREGYSEYTQTGAIADVEDMRIIRRAAGNQDNDWLLQGDNTDYSQNYQTGTFPNTYPTIIASTVNGGLLGGNGSVFTYGLKSNLEVNEPAAANINVGQTAEFAIVADSIITGGTGDYTYTTAYTVGDASIATVSAANDTVSITGVTAGQVVVAVTVEDELGDTNTVELTVNVNDDLVASAIADQIANVGDTVTVDLSTVFSGGTSPITYSASTTDSAVAIASIVSGSTLSVSAEGAGTADITVTGVDAANDTATVTFTHTVGGVFTASGTMADQELRAGDGSNQAAGTVSIDTLSSFFSGGSAPYTFTATSSADDSASVSVSGDTLTVTAGAASANPSPITITVTGEDATGATVEQTFEVTVSPAYGDVLVDGEVTSLDARQILSAAIEEITLTAAQEEAADVNQDGNVNAFDASVVFRYSLGSIETLPFSSSKVESATLSYGDSKTESGIVTVPLKVEGSNIVSVDFNGSFNAGSVSLESLDISELPEDWMVVTSTSKEGKVRFALAGQTPISEGDIATLTFKLNDDNSKVGLTAKGFANSSEYNLDELSIENPKSFALEQNYPNPFNPTTNVRYQLPASADVTVELFTINGQKVQTLVNTRQNAGVYTLNVDGSRLASGVYIYRIVAKADNQTFTTTKKMTLIK